MKNTERWKPTKFTYRAGKLIASRDPNEISVSSRLIADIVARHYDESLKDYAHGKLLDLGCGKVPLFAAYKEHITENICVDWENSLHNNDFLDFNCDLTKDLPFDDNEFNTIVLSDVLEHIPNPEHLWREMARMLSHNGAIIMNVPFYYRVHEAPHDYYRYTEFALRRFADLSDLKIISLSPIGGAPEIITDIISKNLLPIPIIGKPIAIFLQWATHIFIKSSAGGKVSSYTSKHFPFGYFLIAKKASD